MITRLSVKTETPGEPILRCDWAESRRRCLALAISLLRSREDAEEAVQEALVRGWRHADSCRNRQNPTSWLMTITRRECARVARRRYKKEETRLEVCGERGGDHEPLESVDSTMDLRVAIAQLTDEERTLLDLRYVEQLTQAEVGQVVGLPEGTVKTKLHRIRARIRKEMEIEDKWKI